jgi:hypothetical protein
VRAAVHAELEELFFHKKQLLASSY